MAKQSKSIKQNGQPDTPDTTSRAAAIADRLGSFQHISEVIDFLGASAMDAATGRLSASQVSAANGSIRQLLRSYDMAHRIAPQAKFAMKFLSDGK